MLRTVVDLEQIEPVALTRLEHPVRLILGFLQLGPVFLELRIHGGLHLLRPMPLLRLEDSSRSAVGLHA